MKVTIVTLFAAIALASFAAPASADDAPSKTSDTPAPASANSKEAVEKMEQVKHKVNSKEKVPHAKIGDKRRDKVEQKKE